MIRLDYDDCRYPDDVERIVIAAINRGYLLTPTEAEDLWDRYSDSMAAGWMMLPDSQSDLECQVESMIETES